MRSCLVRSRRNRFLGNISARCWLALRRQSHKWIQWNERSQFNLPRPSACPGRPQILVRRGSCDCLVRAELLLQMWQCRLHIVLHRRKYARGQEVLGRTQWKSCVSRKKCHALFPIKWPPNFKFSKILYLFFLFAL